MGERRRRAGPLRALPYPTPKSDRCQELMLGVIRGLGKLPADDDGIEDRVLACLLVAWGEVAAMQDGERRAEILDSLTPLGNRVVGKLMAINNAADAAAGEGEQSFADLLYESLSTGRN